MSPPPPFYPPVPPGYWLDEYTSFNFGVLSSTRRALEDSHSDSILPRRKLEDDEGESADAGPGEWHASLDFVDVVILRYVLLDVLSTIDPSINDDLIKFEVVGSNISLRVDGSCHHRPPALLRRARSVLSPVPLRHGRCSLPWALAHGHGLWPLL